MTTTQNTVADRLAAIEARALPWNQPCQCIRLNEPETVVVADSNDFYWLIAELRAARELLQRVATHANDWDAVKMNDSIQPVVAYLNRGAE